MGIADLQARAGQGEPRYVPLTIAARMAGLHAVHRISMALFAREKSGRGCRIDVPMFETLASVVLGDHLYGRTFEPPEGGTGYVRLLSPGRRPNATRDGYLSRWSTTTRGGGASCVPSNATICWPMRALPIWPAAHATSTTSMPPWATRWPPAPAPNGWPCSTPSMYRQHP